MANYVLTEREAKLISALMESRERVEETIRNTLTTIAASRELDGPQRLMTRSDGGFELEPVDSKDEAAHNTQP